MSTNSTSHIVLPLVNTGVTLDGRKAYLKALRKFGISTTHYHTHEGKVYKRHKAHADTSSLEIHPFIHSHVAQKIAMAPSPSDVAEVPAQDVEQDSEYLVPVKIGTPPVTLHLDLDTGSSDLWVKGSRNDANLYDPTKSETAKSVDGATWSIHYGDGSTASGDVHTDVIQIGSISVKDQAIEVAQQFSDEFKQGKTDGLLGLAWPPGNTVKPKRVETPVANMIAQGHRGLFSCALDYGDGEGFYTFGGIAPEKAGVKEADIKYIPCVNPPLYWTVASSKITVNGRAHSILGGTGIIDTGTTLVLLPEDMVASIYKQVPGSKYDQSEGIWLIPSKAKIPKIQVDIGGHDFPLNPKSFAYQRNVADGYDLGCIQSRGNIGVNILGDAFINGNYIVFDQEKNRVGIAPRSKTVKEVEESKHSLLDRLLPWNKSSSKVNLNE
ncbi:hypothetical protein Clacol_000833 [Clathrus columnatus]|uniref:Peptidase A1 domain-containing protein n=1 Tax=Clathrus columnatus TaxID=1419009 RepID=A0AAV5A1L9_9AGAM|nr:hypothetical protein Clacol_000833 [Clathrus columnatus]